MTKPCFFCTVVHCNSTYMLHVIKEAVMTCATGTMTSAKGYNHISFLSHANAKVTNQLCKAGLSSTGVRHETLSNNSTWPIEKQKLTKKVKK